MFSSRHRTGERASVLGRQSLGRGVTSWPVGTLVPDTRRRTSDIPERKRVRTGTRAAVFLRRNGGSPPRARRTASRVSLPAAAQGTLNRRRRLESFHPGEPHHQGASPALTAAGGDRRLPISARPLDPCAPQVAGEAHGGCISDRCGQACHRHDGRSGAAWAALADSMTAFCTKAFLTGTAAAFLEYHRRRGRAEVPEMK